MRKSNLPGRPIEDAPVLNIVGLMRYLIEPETGVNLRVAAEIEAIAGRPVLSGSSSSAAARVSDFIYGHASVPDWVDRAARTWCVKTLSACMRHPDNPVLINEIAPVRLSASEERELLAEGLVGTLLSAIANQENRRAAKLLQFIDAIRN